MTDSKSGNHPATGGLWRWRADGGRSEAAENRLRAATRLDPRLCSAHFNLGRARSVLDDPGRAIIVLGRALEVAPKRPEPPYLLGIVESDPDLARAHLERYLRMAPDGPLAADARRRISQF